MQQAQNENQLIDFQGFNVFSGDQIEMQVRKINGYMPWFTEDNLHVKMFRYLPSILFSVDYNLFKQQPAFYHLHSIFWWVLALLFFFKLMSLLVDRKTAMLALFLFAITDINSMAISWISNRHLLLSLTLGLISLYFYISGRQANNLKRILIAFAVLILGLSASESSLGIFGYFILYELILSTKALKNRLSFCAAIFGLAVSYLTIYKVFQFGVSNSYFYVNPFHDFMKFLTELPSHLFANLGGLILATPIDQWFFWSDRHFEFVIYGVLAVLIFSGVLVHFLKSNLLIDRRLIYFAVLSSFVALAPVLSSIPNRRTLVFANIGFTIVLALLLAFYFSQIKNKKLKASMSGLMIAGLTCLHIFLPLYKTFETQLDLYSANTRLKNLVLSPALQIANPETKDLVVLNTPSPEADYIPIAFQFYTGRNFKTWHFLSMTPFEHQFVRISDSVIRLKMVDNQELLSSPQEVMYRGPDQPFQLNQRTELGIAQAKITALGPNHGPTQVDFHFMKPINSDDFLFVTMPKGSFQSNWGLTRYYLMTDSAIFNKVTF